MKKILIMATALCSINLMSFSADIPGFDHKEIKYKDKIFFNVATEQWSNKNTKNSDICFEKKVGFNEYGDYIKTDGDLIFATNCDFDFIHNGRLFGYSSSDLKFYEFIFENNRIIKTPLTKEEIQKIIPNYKIAPISMFSANTNSLRIRKDAGNLKLFILNDTDKNFHNYKFIPVNSLIKTYDLAGFLKVEKGGMIKFTDENTFIKGNPYILMVH